jgi:SAM-dependent methyltransferase
LGGRHSQIGFSSTVTSPYSLEEHYRVERQLADRLRHATREERGSLYAALYDELFRRLPAHLQLTLKQDPSARAADVASQMAVLRRFLTPRTTLLEIGAGDCALSIAAAPLVRRAIALDVSANITEGAAAPENFSLLLSDGRGIPVPGGSIDVAYSNQLMEHLHPEDARDQLRSIVAALAPGGIYLCITPNRLSGPHDVSRTFDDEATGFHLKEYTSGELARLFREAGFSRVWAMVGARRRLVAFPVAPLGALEATLDALPAALRRAVARRTPVRQLLEIRLVGRKQ